MNILGMEVELSTGIAIIVVGVSIYDHLDDITGLIQRYA